jgi:hypothetical protein
MEAGDLFAARARYGGPRVVGNKSVLGRGLRLAQVRVLCRVAELRLLDEWANFQLGNVSCGNYRDSGSAADAFRCNGPARFVWRPPTFGDRPVATGLCYWSPARFRRPATSKKPTIAGNSLRSYAPAWARGNTCCSASDPAIPYCYGVIISTTDYMSISIRQKNGKGYEDTTFCGSIKCAPQGVVGLPGFRFRDTCSGRGEGPGALIAAPWTPG